MKLTADTLSAIAAAVSKLADAGLDAPQLRVEGHRVLLERHDSQMDGVTWYVVGIEPAT